MIDLDQSSRFGGVVTGDGMAGQKKAMRRVRVVQGVNPRECPNHGEPSDNPNDEPTACLDCDRAVRAIGHSCWKHGEINAPDPELLRGAPAPAVTPEEKPRAWRVEVPGFKPLKMFAWTRVDVKKSAKKLLQLDVIPPGTKITELPS